MTTRALCLGLGLLVGIAMDAGSAHACSVPAPQVVRAVSHANPSGPLIFLWVCSPHPTTCAAGPFDLRVRSQLGGEEPGTTKWIEDVPERGKLLAWTPAAALNPSLTYTVYAGGPLGAGAAQRGGDTFQIGPAGSAAPFEGIGAVASWVEAEAGARYSCRSRQSNQVCSEFVSWSTESHLKPVLSVRHPRSDGWLFRCKGGNADRWDPEPSCGKEIIPTVSETGATSLRGCVTIEAWNVLDGTTLTQEVCATPTELSEAERRRALPTPDLSHCISPPTRDGSTASELHAIWCEQRRSPCRGSQVADCAEFHAQCEASEPKESNDAGDSSVDQADPGAEPDTSATDAAPEAQGEELGGCSLSRATPRGETWVSVCAGLALCLAARRKSPRVPR